MRISRSRAALAVACASLVVPAVAQAKHDEFQQVNLVSDLPGVAELQDTGLVNAWGLAAGPSTPLWVADNGSDQSSIYTGATKHDPTISIARPPVAIPDGAPTGAVFNDTT